MLVGAALSFTPSVQKSKFRPVSILTRGRTCLSFLLTLFMSSPRRLEISCLEYCHGSCPSPWHSPPLVASMAPSSPHHGQLVLSHFLFTLLGVTILADLCPIVHVPMKKNSPVFHSLSLLGIAAVTTCRLFPESLSHRLCAPNSVFLSGCFSLVQGKAIFHGYWP